MRRIKWQVRRVVDQVRRWRQNQLELKREIERTEKYMHLARRAIRKNLIPGGQIQSFWEAFKYPLWVAVRIRDHYSWVDLEIEKIMGLINPQDVDLNLVRIGRYIDEEISKRNPATRALTN